MPFETDPEFELFRGRCCDDDGEVLDVVMHDSILRGRDEVRGQAHRGARLRSRDACGAAVAATRAPMAVGDHRA